MGERERPLRRQASAAAVAIGPGMPFTITRMAEESKESEDIWREVRHCCWDWLRAKPLVVERTVSPRMIVVEIMVEILCAVVDNILWWVVGSAMWADGFEALAVDDPLAVSLDSNDTVTQNSLLTAKVKPNLYSRRFADRHTKKIPSPLPSHLSFFAKPKTTMKFITAAFLAGLATASAFTTAPVSNRATTELNARKPFISGNWKLNPQTKDEALTLGKEIASSITDASPDVDVALFVPYVFIESTMGVVGDKLSVGAEVRCKIMYYTTIL
jgi:hypothetical protein